MKKTLFILLSLAVSMGISAQKRATVKSASKPRTMQSAGSGKSFYQKYQDTDNEEISLRYLERAAGLNYGSALYDLADYYKDNNINAEKVEELYDKAIPQLKKEAAAGDVNAYLTLGFFYLHGEGAGTEEDKEIGISWYKKAAMAGNVAGMFNLADCYRNGDGTEENPAEAHKWFLKAALAGDEDAMSIVATNYFEGDGVEKNNLEGEKWIRKVYGRKSGKEIYKQFDEEEDENLSAILLKLACEKNYPPAIIASAYEIEEENPSKAKQLYSKALPLLRSTASRGDTESMLTLAELYQNGYGVNKDAYEADKWYLKAAQTGDARAMFTYADYLTSGKGMDLGLEKANVWYERAAREGHEKSLDMVWGKAKERDMELFSERYPISRLGEGDPGTNEWIDLCNNEWLEICAEGGKEEAMMMYADNFSLTERFDDAIRWWEKCTQEFSNGRAMFNIGVCYFEGKGVMKDYRKAVYWFEKALESSGFAAYMAKSQLGMMYNKGVGVSRSETRGKEYYSRMTYDEIKQHEKAEKKIRDRGSLLVYNGDDRVIRSVPGRTYTISPR